MIRKPKRHLELRQGKANPQRPAPGPDRAFTGACFSILGKLVEVAGTCRRRSNNFSPIKINDLHEVAGNPERVYRVAHRRSEKPTAPTKPKANRQPPAVGRPEVDGSTSFSLLGKLVEVAGTCRRLSNSFSPIKINDLHEVVGNPEKVYRVAYKMRLQNHCSSRRAVSLDANPARWPGSTCTLAVCPCSIRLACLLDDSRRWAGGTGAPTNPQKCFTRPFPRVTGSGRERSTAGRDT